jgi:ribosomal-protein-alanine N-acetyltransferase
VSEPSVRFERLDAVSPSERDGILALETASFSNPWTLESFEAMRSSPVSRVYVARPTGGPILGFCACWLIVDELHIHTVAVHPDHRRRGIAAGLIRHILADTGAIRATLEVRRSNRPAIALYEALGFKVSAVREHYYDNPREDGLILWLNP